MLTLHASGAVVTMATTADIMELRAENTLRATETAQLKEEARNTSKQFEERIEKLEYMLKAMKEDEQRGRMTRKSFADKDARDMKPAIWSGEGSKVPFKEFSDSLLNWASVLHAEGIVMMEKAARGTCDPSEFDDPEEAKEMANKLYAILVQCTSGEPRTIIRSVPRTEGFHAWHDLCKYYDPRTASDELAEHARITHPTKRAKDYLEAQIMMNAWLNEVNLYQARYEPISGKTKMAALKNLMPLELFNKEFRGKTFKDFEDMVSTIKAFLADRPANVNQVGSSENKKETNAEVNQVLAAAIEQLNVLYYPKGKGKGYGKDYGQSWQAQPSKGWGKGAGGKSEQPKGAGPYGYGGKANFDSWQDKGKGKGKGLCWTCQQPGHLQWQCPKGKGKGKASSYGLHEINEENWNEESAPNPDEDRADEAEAVEGDMMAYSLEAESEECQMCGDDSGFPNWQQVIPRKRQKMPKYEKPKKVKKASVNLNLLESKSEEDIELNVLPMDTSGEWELIEGHVDSGATDSVGPKNKFPQFALKPSKGSLAGKNYVSATKHKVPNLGERTIEFQCDDGHDMKIKLQEADIGKVLISAAKLTENFNDVNLSRRNPHIRNLRTGRVTKLHRKGGQFILHMWVRKSKSGASTFTRQGS